MNKKISLGAVLSIIFITAAVSVSITMIVSMKAFSLKSSEHLSLDFFRKITEIDTQVRDKYVDTVDEKVLEDAISRGYLNGIGDPYAYYFSASDFKAESESAEGSSVGIGVEASPTPDGQGIYIHEVMADSPAQTAGLKKGDVITEVGEKKISEVGYDELRNSLMGKVNDKRRLVVLREGNPRTFDVTLSKYTITSVYYDTIDKTTGYIRITEFNENTDEQFDQAVKDLKNKGITSLVFDVRNNGGGRVDSVCNILDSLIPAGTIMSTQDKKGTVSVFRTSDAKQLEMGMVVLANKNSASAAELFACVLRDYQKAKLVGVTTYGKCTMCDDIRLSDNSAIRISTALIIPPKSPSYEGKGLTPDFELELTSAEEKSFSFMTFETDPQIRKALEVLKDPRLNSFE